MTDDMVVCDLCKGTGIKVDHFLWTTRSRCGWCGGLGKVRVKTPCPTCGTPERRPKCPWKCDENH